MAYRNRRKCKCCLKLFRPDPRNHRHQRYCSAPNCRAASKADSQVRWLAKPENADYFRGPANVARVQTWRARHPGYWRKSRHVGSALQDPLRVQPIDIMAEITISAGLLLQEVLLAQPAVSIGLIAHIAVIPLQEDIARSTDRLLRRGQDIRATSTTDAREAIPFNWDVLPGETLADSRTV